MNSAELNTELTKVIRRAMDEGLRGGKMEIAQVVGLLEIHKSELLRLEQDMRRVQLSQIEAKKNLIHLPNNGRLG
jgi:hypothetical protein